MALADLATLAKRVERLEREARVNPKLAPALAAARSACSGARKRHAGALVPQRLARAELARESFLLTRKPVALRRKRR